VSAYLADRVRAARSHLDREVGEARALARAGQAAEARVAELTAALELHERVIGVLTKVGEERQQHAQEQVEGLVTQGLRHIFQENLSFHLVQGQRAGQATVDFVLRSHYGERIINTPVMDARGGGMAAVVGFLLRLVVLLLTPEARRILFLDESFAHVSAEFRQRLAEFLWDVCTKAGVQIVLVTHDPEYAALADEAYDLALGSDGATVVTQS
jgi:DNA repair ATPase RecN